MVHGVKCDLSGVTGNLAIDIGLGDDGGNTVLLIDGPVSELGDLCCKNWTTSVVSFIWLDDDSASVLAQCTG